MSPCQSPQPLLNRSTIFLRCYILCGRRAHKAVEDWSPKFSVLVENLQGRGFSKPFYTNTLRDKSWNNKISWRRSSSWFGRQRRRDHCPTLSVCVCQTRTVIVTSTRRQHSGNVLCLRCPCRFDALRCVCFSVMFTRMRSTSGRQCLNGWNQTPAS